MSDTPIILYFDVRGRAEPIRLLLEEVGQPWEEQLYSLDEWLAEPPSTPFHRLPIYREGSLEIPETYAILSYLGRKHDLLGSNERERVRCDVTLEAWRDYYQRLGVVMVPGMEALRAQFFEEQHPRLMEDLEIWYRAREPGSDFWAGSLTIADFAAFCAIDDLMQRAPEILESFVTLRGFHRWFAARPKISTWLTSPRRQTAMSYSVQGGKREDQPERG